MNRFYCGFPDPSWLSVPAETRPAGTPGTVGGFVQHHRLTRRPRSSPHPKATIGWALDSGVFGAADTGRELVSPEQYARDVWRLDQEIGMLEWAAQQDRMCEPPILAKMGWTVEDNQAHGITNFKRLTDLWWDLHDAHMAEKWDQPDYHTAPEHRVQRADECPFMPTLQGWDADDYRRHVDMYYAAGIELEHYQLVGLGSVCRRATLKPIQKLVRELSGFLCLHGFGLKTEGIAELGPVLASADSMAWSLGARHRLGACRHGRVKLEKNCPTYALEWASDVWAGAGEDINWPARWTGRPADGWTGGGHVQLELDMASAA